MTSIAHIRSPHVARGDARLLAATMTLNEVEEDRIAEYERRRCLECGEPQFMTPEGVACPQGHVNVGTILV